MRQQAGKGRQRCVRQRGQSPEPPGARASSRGRPRAAPALRGTTAGLRTTAPSGLRGTARQPQPALIGCRSTPSLGAERVALPTLPPRIPIAGGRRRARAAEGRDWPRGGRGRAGGGACPPLPVGGRERLRRARGRHEVPAGSGVRLRGRGEESAAVGPPLRGWSGKKGAGADKGGALGLARRVWARGERRRGGEEEDVSVGRRVGLERWAGGLRYVGRDDLGVPVVG